MYNRFYQEKLIYSEKKSHNDAFRVLIFYKNVV